MHFLSADLERYIADKSSQEPPLLQALSRETHLKVLRPRMITGHHQGRVLSMIAKLVRPRFVLELGTYTGYSALCLAEGLAPDGMLHTIEKNEELLPLQQRYFAQSDYRGQIVGHLGDALAIIPDLDYVFDLVFIDADKQQYPEYLEAVLPKTRTGSLILSDNVLWSGKVVEPLDEKDLATKTLLAYNERLAMDKRLETVILPVRDGLTLSRVIA